MCSQIQEHLEKMHIWARLGHRFGPTNSKAENTGPYSKSSEGGLQRTGSGRMQMTLLKQTLNL